MDKSKGKTNKYNKQANTKLDEATVSKLEMAFAMDASVEEACYYANISRTSYYSWIKENKKLAENFDRLRQKPVLTARQEVVKGLKGNPEFALRYLERKRSGEFNTRIINDDLGRKNEIDKLKEQLKNWENEDTNKNKDIEAEPNTTERVDADK